MTTNVMNTIAAVLIVLLGITGMGIAAATACTQLPGDFSFSEQIIMPSATGGNLYEYHDVAQMGGWNQWEHQSDVTLHGFSSMSIFQTLPCIANDAPLSTSSEIVTLNSQKGNNPADPYMGSLIETWTTVGTVNLNDPTNPTSRYDTILYNIGGSFDGTTGIRGVNTVLTSSQDDYIRVRGWDNAGYDYPIESDFAEAIIPGHTGESQTFREFNWADLRSWNLGTYDWNNHLVITYKEFPIAFNAGLN